MTHKEWRFKLRRPQGSFTFQDHMDLVDTLRHARSKRLMTNGDHPKIRKLYDEFPMERVKKRLSVPKIICDKRLTFKQLIVRNYEHPKVPLCVPIAGQQRLLNLFHLA